MPTARHLVGCAVLRGRVYVLAGAGNEGENVLDTVECYDPKTRAWTTCAPLPTRLKRLQCVVAGDTLYALGGEAGGVYQVRHFKGEIPRGSIVVANHSRLRLCRRAPCTSTTWPRTRGARGLHACAPRAAPFPPSACPRMPTPSLTAIRPGLLLTCSILLCVF